MTGKSTAAENTKTVNAEGEVSLRSTGNVVDLSTPLKATTAVAGELALVRDLWSALGSAALGG